VLSPDSGPIDEGDRLSDIVIADDRVTFSICVSAEEARAWEPVRRAAAEAVRRLTGARAVSVVLTDDRPQPPRKVAPTVAPSLQPGNTTTVRSAIPTYPNLAGVRRIIAVASGKGGVGKSTTACNLALALAAQPGEKGPLRVGILDADIHGPSMPKLLALRGQPRILAGRTLAPLESFGLSVMSIGFLVDPDKAMIWRGPMVASAITQMLRDVAWGELDVLVVDMPPGTGDAQLTLAQQAPLAGAVIVSTPQDLALIDARRGVAMFRDVGVPILGLVENMSWFACDDCGKRHYPFGHGGARTEAQRLAIPFLGEIPLDPAIRERSDSGYPIVAAEPDGTAAIEYRRIAAAIRAAI
jgi:ATP-binding protein involved in chromosome partitioning